MMGRGSRGTLPFIIACAVCLAWTRSAVGALDLGGERAGATNRVVGFTALWSQCDGTDWDGYVWTTDGGVDVRSGSGVPHSNAAHLIWSTPGTKEVTVRHPACGSASVKVYVTGSPAMTVNAPMRAVAGQPFQVSASASCQPTHYNWSTSQLNNSTINGQLPYGVSTTASSVSVMFATEGQHLVIGEAWEGGCPSWTAGIAAAFAYVLVGPPPPVLSSFVPTSGSEGLPVLLKGENFASGMTVLFGSATSPRVDVLSRQEAIAYVPRHSARGRLTIITPGGLAFSTGEFISYPTVSEFWELTGGGLVQLLDILIQLRARGTVPPLVLPPALMEYANRFPGADVGVAALCPVDLELRDDRGNVIGKNVQTLSRAVYIESDFGVFSSPIDIILAHGSDLPSSGFTIKVIPEPSAKSTDTFSLVTFASGAGHVAQHDLVNNVAVTPNVTQSFTDRYASRRRAVRP